jgi:hypothetical protein
MSAKTFEVEIIVDFIDESKNEIMKDLIRVAAKQLLTQAMLLQDKRPPQIKVSSGDHFESSTEIMLADLPAEEEPTPEVKAEGAHSHNANVARVAGYTVSDKGQGWKFNDPDGKWSDTGFTTEALAWEGALANIA